MSRFIALALAGSLAGCVVTVGPGYPGYEYGPEIQDGQATCYWDNYNRDDVFFFDAIVWDYDNLGDITQVYADVYTWDGYLVQTFDLYRDEYDASYWWSDWLASTTALQCGGVQYDVDLVAYDYAGNFDVITVRSTWQ